MIQNSFGEMIFSATDVCDLIMQGNNPEKFKAMIVDETINTTLWPNIIDNVPEFLPQQLHSCSESEFHARQQQNWNMPHEYKHLDIAEHVLNMCNSEAELQRCGTELLLYQERDLFNLLKYLAYLVDVMRDNHIIWGVGRGSSVASYVLYKLGVHRIDSLYYNLDIREFLR